MKAKKTKEQVYWVNVYPLGPGRFSHESRKEAYRWGNDTRIGLVAINIRNGKLASVRKEKL